MYHRLFDILRTVMTEKDQENSYINNTNYGKVYVGKSNITINDNTLKI